MVDSRPETSELRRVGLDLSQLAAELACGEARVGLSLSQPGAELACGEARVGLDLSQKLSAISISPAAIASVKRS
jgi:hypothetical protein